MNAKQLTLILLTAFTASACADAGERAPQELKHRTRAERATYSTIGEDNNPFHGKTVRYSFTFEIPR